MLACYNESTDELTNCINSITCQQTLNSDKRCIIIVCDGMVKGKGNDNNTNIILKNIENVAFLQNFIASNLNCDVAEKQKLLAVLNHENQRNQNETT